MFDAPRKVERVAYLTLCRPILEYASGVLDPYLIRQITSLEDIQRKGVKFISGIRGRQSVTEARFVGNKKENSSYEFNDTNTDRPEIRRSYSMLSKVARF